VASGQLDAYFERDTKPWDHAAGSLILRESGGVVGGLGGAPEGRDMLLASNSHLFSQIEKVLLG
jgi:myo-inositol-1(or 4)-monophosphatase